MKFVYFYLASAALVAHIYLGISWGPTGIAGSRFESKGQLPNLAEQLDCNTAPLFRMIVALPPIREHGMELELCSVISEAAG